MSHVQPSYEELVRRCREAEAMLEAVRSGRNQAITGEEGTVLGRLAEAEQRAAHIKQILRAIRNVNQLIVRENDPQRLIGKACRLLTETMGYFNAWIALLDEAGKAVCSTASAGFDGGFKILRGGLEGGEFPPCMTRALNQDAPVVIENPPDGCAGCPLAGEYGGRAGLAHRLAFGDRIFGVLVVSVPAAYAHDDEEQSLFQEVANDLAFALHKIDSEARHLIEHRQAEGNLRSAYSKLQAIWSVASLSDASVKNIADHILASIVRMTESQYGFYGFVNDDESAMTIHAWSGEAMKNCSLVDKPQVFPVDKAGIWAEAIRRREPLILNDYAAVHEAKKGFPQGHVPLHNLLVVPFFTHGKITAVAAVANRPADYTTEDAEQLTSFLTSVQAISEGKRAEEALRDQNRLLEAIRVAQTLSLTHDDERKTFKHLLDTLVNLTGSEYGFLDEVCRDPHGEMYKLSLALSDISWDESSRRLYEGLVARQLEFRNLKNLAGIPATTGRLVIANDPGRDDRSGRLPPGHPPLRAFMGIPLFFGKELVGVAGVANRPGGYDENIAVFLEPFVNACAAIIHAKRANHHKQKLAEALQKSETKFRNLFEHSPVAIWVEDFSAGMAYLNELRAAGIHDFRSYLTEHPDELEYLAQRATLREANQESVVVFKVRSIEDLKIPLSSIFLEDSWAAFREIVIALAEGQSFFEIEMPVRNMADERVELHVRLSVAPGHEDTLSRLFVSFVNITERKQAEEALRRSERVLRSMIDAITESAFLMDPRGIILACNKTTADRLGLRPADLIGKNIYEFLPPEVAVRRRVHVETVIASGRPMRFKDEREGRSFHHSVYPVLDDEGQVSALAVIGMDMTEQKQAEEALLESSRKLQEAIRAGNVGLWDWDLATNRVRYSAEWKRQIGYEEHEIRDELEEWETRVHPEDMPSTLERIRQAIADTLENYCVEFRLRHKDGSYRWIMAQASIFCDKSGKPFRVVGSHIDITERKQVEEALRASEYKFRNILINTPQIGISLDPQARIVFANRHFLELTGWEAEEVIGRNWFDLFIPEEGREEVRDLFYTVMHERDTHGFSSHENDILTRTGERRNIAWSNVLTKDAQGEIIDVTCLGVDLTERKRAERALTDSVRQWQRTFDAVSDSVWLLDRESRIIRCNKAGGSLISREVGEILGRHCWELVHGTSEPIPECPAVRMRETLRRESVEMPLGDRWYEVTVDPILDDAGTLTGAVHVVSDITERKRAELALRESEERYRRIVNTAQEGIWLIDAERRTTFVNPHMAAMLGYRSEEMLGRPFEYFMFAEDLGDHAQRMRERYQGRPDRYERRFRGKDGREIWTIVSAVALMDDAGRFAGSFGMFTDITERKEAEAERMKLTEQLRQLQKLDMAGRLAAGFAHDFNNLLCVIQSQLQLVHLAGGLDECARESLGMIEQAANQALALTQALRTFGRGLPTQKQVVNLSTVVREAEPFLRHCLPARVQVEVVIKDEVCPILADTSQLHQVLLNLALNARDAMPDGGRLQVTVGKMDTAEFALADEEGSAVPGSVRLSVADTGVGMTPETLERVFEPFFSTKPHDQGTGLGLLIVQGIVKDHEGSIHIESRVNQGTTVHILLPVVSPVIANETASPPRVRGNGEGIFLAGGNAYLRGTIAAYLDSLNYRAILGGDEAEIVRTWLCHRSEVRLIILSAVLRSREAETGFKTIRAEDPSMPVIILCSREGGIQVADDERTIILKEPYRMTDLAGAVVKILTDQAQEG